MTTKELTVMQKQQESLKRFEELTIEFRKLSTVAMPDENENNFTHDELIDWSDKYTEVLNEMDELRYTIIEFMMHNGRDLKVGWKKYL